MLCDFEDAGNHIGWVVQDRIGFTTADQCAVWIVIAVGKGLANDRQAGLLCDLDGHATRQQHYWDVAKCFDAIDNCLRLCVVVHDGVVHCAMWLHVGNLGAVGSREGVECTDLIRDFIGKLCRIVIEKSPAKRSWIVVSRVRTHGHAGCGCRFERASNGVRVTCVETCCHVG